MQQTVNGNKVALITGASSGIGKEIAKQLLKEGGTVYGAARRVEHMQELSELGAYRIKMDITQEEDIINAINEITQTHGGIDVLVNNAGFGSYGALEDIPIDDARYQFEVNLFGLARLTQLVLPYMREQMAGKIINISSIGGKIYTPLGAWYHATKHALEGLSDSLRLELSPFNIDVIVVEPGLIQTEFGSVLLGPLMSRSGHSAYAEIAKQIETATQKSYAEGGGSHPSVIAKIVAKAVRAKKPKTRYVAGKMAKPLVFLRKCLSDRMFDKAVMSAVKA